MRQDTLPGRVHSLAPTFAKFIGLVLAFTLLGVGSFVILLGLFGLDLKPFPATRKACDRAVEMLLTSRDPVELQRSGILIHELDCSIGRRLPEEP